MKVGEGEGDGCGMVRNEEERRRRSELSLKVVDEIIYRLVSVLLAASAMTV